MISKELVVAAYRLILGREPENEQVVETAARSIPDWATLREVFFNSPEFGRNTSQFIMNSRFPLDVAPRLEVEVNADRAAMERILQHIQRAWTEMGKEEPFWSVLTFEEFKSKQFSEHSDAFWKSGQGDVTRFRGWLERNGLDFNRFPVILEYGCGTGRVTYWLAQNFKQVFAWDISGTHLNLAKERLSAAKIHNVEPRLVSLESLERIPAVDAVFSILVLQHNPPPVIHHILSRLLGSLLPGGIGYFQVPTYLRGYRFRIEEYLQNVANVPCGSMELHALPQSELFRLIEESRCRILEVEPDNYGGTLDAISTTFLVQKM